ncbi:hypothetical protein A3A67_05275 [Candidatus Peribacteria bacterium RIFCSPLOWO2_01_FULL_51_18]|nr:MAG: hypothetical protein A3A67_05275 [Candidatus Peribacteria bacterium RIFCSPLOWO2_01_FULL_51_18]
MLIALAVFGVIGGTTYQIFTIGAQSDPVQACISGCASMTCPENTDCASMRATCESGCANMGSYTGGNQGMPANGTCETQPNWPDCETFSCTSGNWTCAQMKSGTNYNSGTNYSPDMNGMSCTQGCDAMPSATPETRQACYDTCNRSGTTTTSSGTSGTTGTSGVQRCFFPAEWYSVSQGKQWGGTLNCKPDKTDCREGSETSSLQVSGQITFNGEASGCYPVGGSMSGGSSGGWGGGPQSMRCVYPNGKILWCRSPHVDCSESAGGRILSSQEVGSNGATADCSGGSQGGSGGESGWSGGGGSMQGGTDQCFADCSRGISGSDPAYAACRTRCYGGDMPSPTMRDCGPNEFPTAQNPCRWQPMSGGTQGGSMSCTLSLACHFSTPACATPVETISCSDPRCMNAGSYNNRPLCNPAGASQGGTGGYRYNQNGDYQGNFNQGGLNQGGYNQGGYGSGQNGYHSAGPFDQPMPTQQAMGQQMLRRMAPELQRNCDQFSTMFGPPGSEQKIKDLGNQCRKDMEAMVAGASPENMGNLQFTSQQKMNDYRMKLDAIFYESQAVSMKADTARYIKEMELGAKSASEMIAKIAAKNPVVAQQMKTLQAKAFAAVEQARAAQDAGQYQQVFAILDGVQRELMERERQWQSTPGGLGMGFGPDNGKIYDDFAQKHGYDDKMKGYFETQGFDRGDMTRMDTLQDFYKGKDDDTLDEYLEFQSGQEGDSADLLAVADDLSITEMKNLIDLKTSLLKEIEDAKAELSALKASAKAVVSELIDSIRQFNFADSAIADKAAELALQAASGQNVDTAKAEYQKLVKKSVEQEYLKGIAPFADVSKLNPEWYAGFAEKAKEEGIVTGNPDGTLGAALAVNNAAAVKMLANALGIEPAKGDVPAKFASYPKWAKEAVAGLAQADIDLSMFDRDPNGAVTRAEFAEAAANLLPEELKATATSAQFKDIGSLPRDTQQTINTLADLGVVDADGTYDPEDELTKAALTKFLVLTKEAAVDYLTTQEFSGSDVKDSSDAPLER